MRRNAKFVDSLARANSHLRYWRYRRELGSEGGPTLLQACIQWWRRFVFEWLGKEKP